MIENQINIQNRFTMRVNFNLKSLANVGSKKSQIWLTTTINGKRVRVYTGLLIEQEYWKRTTRSEVGECAIVDTRWSHVVNEQNKSINKELIKILKYCKEYGEIVSRQDLMSEPIEHSAENFKRIIECKIRGVEAQIRKNPKDFIEDYIKRKARMTNRDTQRRIVSGTVYNHKNALRRLMLFCEEERLGLVWELFNDRFEERFTAWMQDKEYSANTIASQYSIMKVWLSEAEMEGLITDKHFHRWTTKCHDVENIYLTEEEIERIYHLDFSSEELRSQIDPRQRIEETRDMFVVACWTGLRFGDWKDLSKIQIVGDTMTVHTRKTNKTVVIPLHPFVKEIYEKYGQKFPKVVDKTHTLSQIRQCARWADYIEWNTAVNIVHRLFRDGDYRMSLLVGCGIFFGLRISDLLQLSWEMLLDGDSFTITERKTGKRRTVRINRGFQKHIRACHKAMRITDDASKCFANAAGEPLSVQRVNVLLKQIKGKYSLKTVKNTSSHSLRKTFGRKVFESAGENANMALVRLSELFNHSNVAITKIYLGIRQEELLETYDLLDF